MYKYIFILIASASSLCTAQTRLSRAVVSDAGGRTSNGTKTMDYTIGQAATGTASSANMKGSFGFWNNAVPTSGVAPEGAGPISSISISPNPATSSADVRVSLASSGKLDLGLYDASGRLVSTIYSGTANAGSFSAHIDAKSFASGAYYLAARMPGALLESRVSIVR